MLVGVLGTGKYGSIDGTLLSCTATQKHVARSLSRRPDFYLLLGSSFAVLLHNI